MRTAYVAEVLKDGHLSFPAEIKQRFHIRDGMKIKVTLEDVGKTEEKTKEAALQYLLSQEIDFASWGEEKEGLLKQRIADIETVGH